MNSLGTPALLVWAAVAVLVPTLAFRTPVLGRRTGQQPHSAYVLYPYAQDMQEGGHVYSNIPPDSESGISALQLKSRSEKEESDNDEKGFSSEDSASQSEGGKGKGSGSESADEAEEEGDSAATQPEDDTKAEIKAQGNSEGEVPEAETKSEKESHAAQIASGKSAGETLAAHPASASVKESPTVPPVSDAAASAAASHDESASHATPSHGPEASEKDTAAERKAAESRAEAQPEGKPAKPIYEHAAESQAEAAHYGAAERANEPVVERKEHKEDAAGAGLGEATVPPPEKMVIQLNFRPSMVIGKADADRLERHVITAEGGTTWYQVIGTKDLTILKLKPMEGEKILHQETVTEQPN